MEESACDGVSVGWRVLSGGWRAFSHARGRGVILTCWAHRHPLRVSIGWLRALPWLTRRSVRSKNVQSLLFKNLIDCCTGAVAFYLFGYATCASTLASSVMSSSLSFVCCFFGLLFFPPSKRSPISCSLR